MSTGSPRPADSHHLLDDSTLHQHDSLLDEQQRQDFYDIAGGRGGAEGTMTQNSSSSSSSYTKKMNASSGGVSGISTSQRMISATWGSILTSLLVTPLDVVRVRLQSQTTPTPAPINLSRFPAYATQFEKLPPDLGVRACCREVFWMGDNAPFCLAGNGGAATATATTTNPSTVAAGCAVEETQKRTFNSTMDGLRKIARNEGFLTLWRGLSPTLAMAIPANVIYFAGYDWMRFSEASPIRKVAGDTYSPLVAGAGARVLAAIVVSPIEMFRTRMQAASGSATGVFKETLVGLHRMTQSQGYTSLWRGLTLTMWRDVPFSAIYWWGYEGIRNSISDARSRSNTNSLTSHSPIFGSSSSSTLQDTNSHTSTFIDSFTAGAISGAASAFVTTPFDVGKTKQQVYRHAGDDSSSHLSASQQATKIVGKTAPEQLSMPRFLYHIYQEQGTSGLFKGWGPRCLKVAPACAIMISTYELGKKWAVTSKEKKREGREAI